MSEALPFEIRSLLTRFRAKECILMRLNESKDSSVVAILVDEAVDILDYRVSFVQLFLRQTDIFYQYKLYYEELKELQLYLKCILDQVPVGIIITSEANDLFYVNAKVTEDFNEDFSSYISKNVSLAPLDSKIINIINNIHCKNMEVNEQITVVVNEKSIACNVRGYRLLLNSKYWTVTVITNVQKAKELFKQMKQSNRLAMISKIAVSIGNELEGR